MNDQNFETTPGSMTGQPSDTTPKKARFGCLHVLGIVCIVMLVTALLTAWWIKRNIYASHFEPTHLNATEQQTLNAKLARLDESAAQETSSATAAPDEPDIPLQPESSDDEDVKREISISEKELNALLAKDPQLAERVMIDLTDDLVSVRVIIPVDADVPLLGGKTIRLKVDVALRYENNKPMVAIRGISIGGIPLPGAWWGDIKNKNLVEEFGDEGGFWDQFSKGVADLRVRDGQLWVKLKE